MKAVFADTFYWVAISNSRDARFQDAFATKKALRNAMIVTTDEVLAEYLTYVALHPAVALDCDGNGAKTS